MARLASGQVFALDEQGRVQDLSPEGGPEDPLLFPDDRRFVRLVAEGSTACGLTEDGEILCASPFDDPPFHSLTRTPTAVRRFALDNGGGCLVDDQRRVICDALTPQGTPAFGPAPEAVQGRAEAVAVGGTTACVLDVDDLAICWVSASRAARAADRAASIAVVDDVPDLAVRDLVGVGSVAFGVGLEDGVLRS